MQVFNAFYRFEGNGLRIGSHCCPRYLHDCYKEVFGRLLEAIRQGSGCVLLTGAPGTGKTTLVGDLAASLESRGYVVRKLSQLTTNGVEMASLTKASVYSGADDAIKFTPLEELVTRLGDGEIGGGPVVLEIDDAHNLSDEAFEKLSDLFTLTEKQGHLLQILLAGQERLGERMHLPAQHRIRQFVGESCTLLPLDANQTRTYIAHELKHMGWTGSPEISAGALAVIHARTGGMLRLINLTMSRLLLHGSLNKLHLLRSHDVNTLLDQMGASHPELQHPVLAREQLADSERLHLLLPLDARAAQGIQGSNTLIEEHPLTMAAGQEGKAVPRATTPIRKRLPKGALQWMFFGLATVTIVLYLAFGSGSEGDRSMASVHQASHNQLRPGMFSGDQTEPKQAEPHAGQINTTSMSPFAQEVNERDGGSIAETGKADVDPADIKWWLATPTKTQGHRDLQVGAQVASFASDAAALARATDQSSESVAVPDFSNASNGSENRVEGAAEVNPDEPGETEFKWWIAKSSLESTAHRATFAQAPAKTSLFTDAPPPSDAKSEKWVNAPPAKTGADNADTNQEDEAPNEREQDPVAGETSISETGQRPDSPQNATRAAPAKPASTGTIAAAKNQNHSDPTRQQGHTSSNEIDDLLEQAERALSRDRLTVPARDNAYAYYRRVLARDRDNERARAGVQKIAHRYRQLAEQRLRRGDASGAQSLASRGLKISPRDRQLSAIHRKAKNAQRIRQSDLPKPLQRVVDWFRSGDTNTSAFIDQ